MLTFSLNIKATLEVLMKMQESRYPSKKCSIYENKQNKIPENLAMPQTASEGCKYNELKPESNSSQHQTSNVTLTMISD